MDKRYKPNINDMYYTVYKFISSIIKRKNNIKINLLNSIELNKEKICEKEIFDGYEIIRENSEIKNNQYLLFFNKVSKKFEEITQSKDGSLFNKNGLNVESDILKNNIYVVLKKVNNSKYRPDDFHNLIPGELVYIEPKSKNKFGIVGVVENGSFGDYNPKIKLVNDRSFELKNTIKKKYDKIPSEYKNNALFKLKNLFNQDYLIIHDKKGIKLLNIKCYNAFFNLITKELNLKIFLIDDKFKKKLILVNGDEIGENDLIKKETVLSSLKIINNLKTDSVKNLTNAKRISNYGVVRYAARLSINGFNNFFNFNQLDNGEFYFKQTIELNNIEIGLFEFISVTSEYGEPGLRNVSFILRNELQGAGLSDQFYSNKINLANELGFKYVEMTCSLLVGGYAWAKKGFEFKNPTTSMFFRKLFISAISKTKIEDWKLFDEKITEEEFNKHKQIILNELNKIKLLRNGDNDGEFYYYDSASPAEFANFSYFYNNIDGINIEAKFKKRRYRNDRESDILYSVGKSILLGSTWDGIKRI